MFYYKLGYHGWEETNYVWLSHEKEYNPDDFNKLVIDAIPSIAWQHQKEEIQSVEKLLATNNEQHSENYLQMARNFAKEVRFSDIYEKVADKLCEKHGFARVHISVTCSVWSHDDLLCPSLEEDGLFRDIQIACQNNGGNNNAI